jgi:hypothetical protein
MVPAVLGFVPTDSLVVVCLHGQRGRVGLAMRFDLEDAGDAWSFAEIVQERVQLENAATALAVIFSTASRTDGELPHSDLADALTKGTDAVVGSVVLTDGSHWWCYCCPPDEAGELIDPSTPGATAVTAAYAMAGQGVLPDRAAVVRSVAYSCGADEARNMRLRIAGVARQYDGTGRGARQDVVRVLTDRLSTQLADPRGSLSNDDVAEFAALCQDVVVRDQVLVKALDADSRDRLLPVLREMARRVPEPLDAPVCAMLAWVSYAHGDGVVANVAVERSLRTDTSYPLAELIADALYRQVPPHLLEEVMRGAARDLRMRNGAG